MISAIKKGEESNDWIIRGYNALNRAVDGKITTILPVESACLVHLNEEVDRVLPHADKTIAFSVKAHQIFTIAIRLSGTMKEEKKNEQL